MMVLANTVKKAGCYAQGLVEDPVSDCTELLLEYKIILRLRIGTLTLLQENTDEMLSDLNWSRTF